MDYGMGRVLSSPRADVVGRAEVGVRLSTRPPEKLLLTEKAGIYTLTCLTSALLLTLSIPEVGLEKEHASGES
jgi:hypothetical protein